MPKQTKQMLQDGVVADESGFIRISVWGVDLIENVEEDSPLILSNVVISTIVDKNIGTNDKFYWKVAFFMYMEMFNFRSQSCKVASKPKPHRGLGTRLPSP